MRSLGSVRAAPAARSSSWSTERIPMNLDYTAEEDAFRTEVRAFMEAELPADIRAKVRLGRRMHKDDLMRWQKILHRRGWGAGMWPRRFGGADWTVVEQHI